VGKSGKDAANVLLLLFLYLPPPFFLDVKQNTLEDGDCAIENQTTQVVNSSSITAAAANQVCQTKIGRRVSFEREKWLKARWNCPTLHCRLIGNHGRIVLVCPIMLCFGGLTTVRLKFTALAVCGESKTCGKRTLKTTISL
jgi:hypothetical protein